MASIDERVAYLEGRVEEHGHMVNGIRDAVKSLEQRLASFEARVDQRFAAVDQRFAAIDQRLIGLDHRLDALDEKMTRFFTWLIGLYVTGLVAVVAALVAR